MAYVEEMTSGDDHDDQDDHDEERIESLYTELSYLSEHPFDLNRATADDLERLPFLSETQIRGILAYRERYGRIQTIYELKNMEELNFQTIELLLPFVYISEKMVDKRPVTIDNLVHYGKSNLSLRYSQGFQQKKGYRSQPDSILDIYPNRQYLGEPFYHSLRYSYAFDQRLQWGVVAEKDAGEPFANRHHKGYDFYSFHFILENCGWLKTLVAGDYKMSFGQGLVVSNEFTPGRNILVARTERRTHGFRQYFSTGEKDFFRGAAATARWRDIDISLFYSHKKIDATTADSLIVSSIKTDGLHRLPREREKAGLLPLHAMGGNVRYATPDIRLGITALAYSFGNYSIMPDEKPYNRFAFRGNSNLNMSADYRWKYHRLNFYGEAAISANKAVATLHALQLHPTSYFSFLVQYRYYDRQYQAYFANAFSQNASPQNEQGLYMGLQFTPFAYWEVSAYADFFRFPWLKYGVDAPSAGKDCMAQIENTAFSLRYKYRQKEKNQTPEDGKASVLPYEQHRVRLKWQHEIPAFLFKTSIEGTIYDEAGKRSRGFMTAQSIGWQPPKLPVQAGLYAAYFHTDDYNSRLSSYEKNLLYAFAMPQFYGKGLRLSATLRWDAPKNLSLQAKWSSTHYTDRDTIGTDLEEIEGNTKTDISVVLRRKF